MKLFKLFILLLMGTFVYKGATAQDASINILAGSSGIVSVGGSLFLQVDVTNNDATGTVAQNKLRPQISVPAGISSISATAADHQLPTGWTITSNTGSVIRITNTTDPIPAGATRTAFIKINGGPSTGTGSIIANLTFNGAAPTGDIGANNSSSTGLTVNAAAACNITGASAAAGTIACNGGTTSLTVTAATSGATGTLEYSINGGAYQSSNVFTVPAGIYTAAVREVANTACSATATAVTVSQPTAISATATAGTVLCFGGTTTLSVSATGGTGVYEYSLNGGAYQSSNSFSVNAAGSPYTVTVRDANACTGASNAVTVSQPTAAVSASASVTTPIAVFGGTGTVTVTGAGGTGAIAYSITTGPTVNTTGASSGVFTGLLAGNYVFTTTDANGCTGTASLTVTQPAAVCNLAVTTAAGTIACNGGTTTLTATATGANGTVEYSLNGGAYQLGNTFTVNAAGSPYTVVAREVATPSCTVTATALTVTQPTAISASASVTTAIAAFGGTGTITVTGTGGTGAKTYVITSGTTINTTGATTGVFTGLASGTYTFTVTDANSCTAVSAPVSLVQPGLLSADPAVGQMYFTTLANGAQTANNLLFTQAYKLNVPFYNLNQAESVPNGTIELKINLGSKLILDPSFNLATAPLNNYFTWTSAIVADSVIITGTQTAAIPADFDAVLSFNVRGEFACTATATSKINVVNILATLADDDMQNNKATLQYNLPVTVATTQVNVTCNGAGNGIINAVTSPGATVVIRNAANTVVSSTGLLPGVYTVTATAIGDMGNSCVTTTNVTIVEPAILSTSVSGTVNNICNSGTNGRVTVASTGGTAPYTYVIAGPTVNTTGATTGVFTGLAAGAYTITATDANGCTATITATVTQPTGTAPDISLGSDITGSLFTTPGASQTIVYNIAEIAGNPSVGDTIRITKVAGFTINFNPAIASTVVGGTTYVLDNAKWKIDNSNAAFVSIILTDPLNSSNPGTLLCNQRVNVAITLTRNTPDISTFTLSARLRKSNGELNLGNNLNSIILAAE